jgi:Protein of unknown function (DUF3108)
MHRALRKDILGIGRAVCSSGQHHKRMKKAGYTLGLLRILLTVLIAASSAVPAMAATLKPEVLHYVADMAMFKDAASGTISLRGLGQDKFLGVMEGQTNGLIGVLSAHRKDRYATTMQLVEGKLQPILYTEEAKWGSKHIYKEYRFNYDRKILEMWRRNKKGVMALEWSTELTEPIYDGISAFYNFRIGALGEIKAGNTMSVAGIPYPHPETIVVRVGPQEPNNRQATVTIRQRALSDEIADVHIRFDDTMVPLEAWTKVPLFGKITGRLVSGK